MLQLSIEERGGPGVEEGGLGGGAADGQLPTDQGESAERQVLEGVARGETQRPGDALSKEGPEGGRCLRTTLRF